VAICPLLLESRRWMRDSALFGSRLCVFRRQALRTHGEVMRSKFFCGIDIAERFGLIVESHFDNPQIGVPGIDLAPAGGKKGAKVRVQGSPTQTEHGVRLRPRASNSEVCLPAVDRLAQAYDQVCR
jgi:hypothetical protein